MKIVTTDTIVGEEIVEQLGIAKGEVVQSKYIGQDFLSSLKVKSKPILIWLEKLEIWSLLEGASEILAYGTAVKLKQKKIKTNSIVSFFIYYHLPFSY